MEVGVLVVGAGDSTYSRGGIVGLIVYQFPKSTVVADILAPPRISFIIIL